MLWLVFCIYIENIPYERRRVDAYKLSYYFFLMTLIWVCKQYPLILGYGSIKSVGDIGGVIMIMRSGRKNDSVP